MTKREEVELAIAEQLKMMQGMSYTCAHYRL